MQELLEQGKFYLVEENGDETEYNTLFTFYNEKYNKHYVVYSKDENIYASAYNPNDIEFDLMPVEDDKELKMINKQIAQTIVNMQKMKKVNIMNENKITYVNEENIKKVPVAKAVVKGINGLKNYLLKYLGAGTAIYALLGSAGQKTFNFFISQLTVDIARMSQAEIFGIVARVLGGVNAVLPGAVIAIPLMAAGGILFSVKIIAKAVSKKGRALPVSKNKSK